MTRIPFPPELLSNIFQYLTNDPASLASFSAVSRTFRHESRPWLFRHLELSGYKLIPCLTHLVRDHEAAAYVQRLSFDQDGLSPTLDDWIAARDACREMVNLRVLEIRGASKQAIWAFEFPSTHLQTVYLHCAWADGLEDWLHDRPQITTLHYFVTQGPRWGIDIPTSTLPNLHTLHGRLPHTYASNPVSVFSFVHGRPIREVRFVQGKLKEEPEFGSMSRRRERVRHALTRIYTEEDERAFVRGCRDGVKPVKKTLRRLVVDTEQTALLSAFAEAFPGIKEVCLIVGGEESKDTAALDLTLALFPNLCVLEIQHPDPQEQVRAAATAPYAPPPGPPSSTLAGMFRDQVMAYFGPGAAVPGVSAPQTIPPPPPPSEGTGVAQSAPSANGRPSVSSGFSSSTSSTSDDEDEGDAGGIVSSDIAGGVDGESAALPESETGPSSVPVQEAIDSSTSGSPSAPSGPATASIDGISVVEDSLPEPSSSSTSSRSIPPEEYMHNAVLALDSVGSLARHPSVERIEFVGGSWRWERGC